MLFCAKGVYSPELLVLNYCVVRFKMCNLFIRYALNYYFQVKANIVKKTCSQFSVLKATSFVVDLLQNVLNFDFENVFKAI